MKTARIALIFLLILVLFFSCQSKTGKWEGRVEEVDGVKVIISPDKPFYGDITFELAEELSIGNETDERFLFVRVFDIDVSEEENIYVLDGGNYRLLIFDREGNFLNTVGQRGQGPGEFDGRPLSIFLQDNSIYVREYRRMHVFDREGIFLNSFPLETYLVDFAVDEEGFILGYADLNIRDTAARGIIKMDSQGKTIKKIAEYTDLGIKIVVAENLTYTLSPNHAYTPRLNFSPLGENTFIYGYASEYLLKLIDKDGNLVLKFEKQESPMAISQKEKDYFIDRASESLERSRIKLPKSKIQETLHFGKHRAYFDKILTDNLKRIYVRRIQSVLDTTDEVEFYIFDREGYYLYRTKLPFSPEVISRGCLYDIQTDEETGLIKIIKYRVTNWDLVKEEF
jgi:hypothetical protein